MIRKALAWLLTMTFLVTMVCPQAAPVFADTPGDGQEKWYFLNGQKLDASENVPEEYDGTVAVTYGEKQEDGTQAVTLTPEAAEGREFSLLTLTARNEDGNILRSVSPVSRDYRYDPGSNSAADADGDYAVGIRIAAQDGTGTSLTFSEMPEVTAWFDAAYSGLITPEAMTERVREQNVKNAGKGPMTKSLSSSISAVGKDPYGEGWNAADYASGDYVIFDAGEGRQFSIGEIVAYGRPRYAHQRFGGLTVSYSNDGKEYTPVLQTKNLSGAQQYETPRASYEGGIYARYLKISSSTSNLNISRLNFYGKIETDRIAYYALRELVETAGAIEENGRGDFLEARWEEFTAALAAARDILAKWDGEQKPSADDTNEAAEALSAAMEQLGDGDKQYLAFRDGVLVEKQASPDKLTEKYDGYVEVVYNVNGKDVTLRAAAAGGREFSLLTLTARNADGTLLRSISPLSKDYRYNVDGGAVEANGGYAIGIQLSDADGGGTSLTFAAMPEVTAYFDEPDSALLNSKFLEAVDMNQDYQVKPSRGSMSKMLSSPISAAGGNGSEGWGGTDRDAGDYTVFYAGEGKQFTIDRIAAYSRPRFTHNRFWGLGVSYSNDGVNWTTVFETQNLSEAQQWETGRQLYEKPVYARYLRISSYANNLDISRLNFYGRLEDDRIEYYYLSETAGEAAAMLEKGRQDYHDEAEWKEFEEAYEAAEALLTEWKEKTLTAEARTALSAADKRLAEALIRVKVSFLPAEGAKLVHPAVGVSPEDLKEAREHIFKGEEPWASFYKQFSHTEYAGKNYRIRNDASADGVALMARYDYPDYSTALFNGDMTRDATAAWYQSLQYFMTGDQAYRAKAMRILRLWSQVNPENILQASGEGNIHHASPTYLFNSAAELLRYTSTTEEALVWTEEDTRAYAENYLAPILSDETGWFSSTSNTNWFNQHQTVLYGRMSSMIFLDDKEGYEEVVEWFTVNSSVGGLFHNGAIANAMPLLTKDIDENGNVIDVDSYVAVGEMSRDQPHSYENLRGLMNASRMVIAQGDKVDPVKGTVSDAADAVGIYDFLDQRLVKGANYWCRYNLGDEDMPFWNSRNQVLSDSARGRLYDVFEYYVIYKYGKSLTTPLAEDDPDFKYVVEEYERYQALFGDPVGDMWLRFPEEASGQFTWRGAESTSPYYELEDRANWFGEDRDQDYVELFTDEDGTEGIQIDASESPSIAIIHFYDSKSGKMALRYKSDGDAKLTISRGRDTAPYLVQELPDTENKWKYLILDARNIGTYVDNQIYYYRISSEDENVTVWLDHLIVKDTSKTPPEFVSGKTESSFYFYPGMDFSADLEAEDSDPKHMVSYRLSGGAPDGLTVTADGHLKWIVPEDGGQAYSFLLVADDGESISVTRIRLNPVSGYDAVLDSICSAYDENKTYESATKKVFDEALAAAKNAQGGEQQNDAIEALQRAVDGLRLLNPAFEDETGTSLDYRDLVDVHFDNALPGTSNSISPYLMDGDWGTFSGDIWGKNNKVIIYDFGVNFRFAAKEFRFAPRKDQVGRTGGIVVYASQDGVNWVPVTDFTQGVNEWQTMTVFEDQQDIPYRYFMTKQLTVSGLQPLSYAELRLVGERSELTDLPTAISISSATFTAGAGNTLPAYRADTGDVITLRFTMEREFSDPEVLIEGTSAAIEVAESGNSYIYTATATLTEAPNPGREAQFSISYARADGSGMETIYNTTTDGSTVWISDQSNLIEDVEEKAVMWNNRDVAIYCDDKRDTCTQSIKAHEALVFDFGEYDVQIDRLEVLPGYDAKYDVCASVNRMYVQGSEDGVNWRNIARYNHDASTGWISFDIFDYDKTKNYRYVSFSNANLSEVRFYGTCGKELPENLDTYTVETFCSIPGAGTTQVYYTASGPDGAQAVLSGIPGGSDVTINASANPGYKFMGWVLEKEYFGVEFDYQFAKDSGAEYVLQWDEGDYQGGKWFREVIEDMRIKAIFAPTGEPVDPEEPDGSGGQQGGSGNLGTALEPQAPETSGEGTGDAGFVSDTTGTLSVNGVYQYRITSTNGEAPSFSVDSPAFRAELVSREGNDYFVKVYAVGAPGSTATFVVNGAEVCRMTALSAYGGVISDTTAPFTVAQGGAYQFRLTAEQKPQFAAGSSSFRVEYAGNEGNDWFFKVYAVGKPGDGCGFYINGAPAPVAVAHIAG